MERAYTDAEPDAAIDAISEPARLRAAESMVAAAAPRLQRVLAQALHEGGWFGEAHEAELEKAVALQPEAERLTAVRTLVAEEARMGMLVGVAVGWAIARELDSNDEEE